MAARVTGAEPAAEPGRRGSRVGRALLLLSGVGGAFVLAVLVSTVLAHPAGAAVLPATSAASGAPATVGGALPLGTLSPGGPASPSTAKPSPPPSAPSPAAGLHPRSPLALAPPAVEIAPSQVFDTVTAVAAGTSALVGAGPTLGSSAARPTPTGGGAQAAAPGPWPPPYPLAATTPHSVTGRFLGALARPSPGTVGPPHRAPAPGRPRAPLVPRPVAPLPANDVGIPAPSGSGGAPFGSLPPWGRLLPAALAGGALLAATRARRLLLDLRYSPPG